jgi:hypothetical protein
MIMEQAGLRGYARGGSVLPVQAGANLASLETDEELEQSIEQDEEIEAFADALNLEPNEADEEVIELDDGSVVINYKPTESPQEQPEFYENLAEVFDESTLFSLADEYLELIEVDHEARKERDKQYEEGLRRTGLGKDAPGGATFDGASKVVHPVMAESCVDFAASAAKELIPPDGIVKSEIKGEPDQIREDVADRKSSFMNWQLTEQIPEYRDEFECMLTQLPLGGSQFIKWRWDDEQKRPMCEWVPIDAILLPYASSNFYTAQRMTEVQDITEDEYKQRIDAGIYRDLDNAMVTSIDSEEQTRSQQANDKIEGKDTPSKNVDNVRRIYEITCFLRLDDDSETDGKRAPYILTIDETSGKVLALYRNWAYGDEKLTKLDWYVEFKFIPWRGAYAIGLPHLIGGLSAALTGSLRALLDAAHINNSQTMLKLKGGRIGGQSDRIEPTQVIEIEGAPGVDDVRKIAMAMPFNPPSPVLFQLLGWLTGAAKGVVTTAEEKIAEVNANTPVGTTQALIEQGAKVFSSIHARLHRSQAKSLAILSRINHWYLDEMDNQSGVEIEVRDFADNNDIRPVSDPNIFSEGQRLAQNQAVLQMATQAPQLFDLRSAYYRVLKQLKVPNIDEILPNPLGVNETNPALENVSMTMGRPAAAYPDQDHIAHIKIHLAYAQDPNYGGSPLIGPVYAPHAVEHIKQHLTLHYLQSMRNYVAKASGKNKDTLDLHEEKPIRQEDQQALAVASQLVAMDSQQIFAQEQPGIMQLFQKVQQMAQAHQEQAMMADPTAQVLLKTQMAETQRKAQEAQQDAQMETQKSQQEFQIKVADLQAKVQDLQAKYQTQTSIDSQKNATQIALANINNAAKERVAQITAGTQFTIDQMALEHEQNMSAMEAVQASEQDIRQHGLAVQQQAFEQQAQAVQQQMEMAQAQRQHEQEVIQSAQQHQQGLQQSDQQHQQQMAQMAEQQAAQQPPTEEQ